MLVVLKAKCKKLKLLCDCILVNIMFSGLCCRPIPQYPLFDSQSSYNIGQGRDVRLLYNTKRPKSNATDLEGDIKAGVVL